MYITYNEKGAVMAVYADENKLPATVKARAIFIESMPPKPDAGNYRLMYSPEAGLCWEEIVRKIYLSKLSIRRELRALGMEEMLDGFLESSPEFERDWRDASVLDFNDPSFAAAWEAMKEHIPDPDKFIKKVRA